MISARAIAASCLAAAVLVVAVIIATSGGDDYRLKLNLASANGLRPGSLVKVGGVKVGTVTSIDVDDRDRVIAELGLDRERALMHPDGSAKVITSNLLGSKFIQLDTGRARGTVASGSWVRRISYPTDLDQVLDVFDAPTRARLAILIDELGQALTGRKADFNQALGLLPRDLEAARTLVTRLVSDNHTLGDAVAHSSRFVSDLARKDRSIARLVDGAGATFAEIAERSDDLRATLDKAPGTLASLQAFLARLDATTKPLGPAADALAATAAPLDRTLAEVPAFTKAADPTLRKAEAVAPLLSRLATRSTPVLRKAGPTADSLRRFSRSAAPITRVARVSIDDALGLIEGWGRSIQSRDGLGHYFRGFATISPDLVRSLVDSLVDVRARDKRKTRRPQSSKKPLLPKPAPDLPKPSGRTPAPVRPIADAVPKLLDAVGGVVKKILGGGDQGSPGNAPGQRSPDASSSLLDYLLRP